MERWLPASLSVLLLPVAVLLFFAPQPRSAQTTPSSAIIPNAETVEFPWFSFNRTSQGNFSFLGDSAISQDALQITPDTSNNAQQFLVNKSGRVVLNRQFKLWHEENDGSLRLASFSVSFDINIFNNWTAGFGEGLAFAILPNMSNPPPNSFGGFLGLTNAAIDGDPNNKFVAVELDTTKQDYDPDNNHIALDINSVKSNPNVTVPLNASGFDLVPTVRRVQFYTLWVEYNGTTMELDVYMARKNPNSPASKVTKPSLPLIHSAIDLTKIVAQYSYFGFSASTGATNYELNCVVGWSIAIESLPREPRKGRGLGLKVGLPVGLVVLALALVSFLYVRRRRKSGAGRLGVRLKSMPGMPREFKYEVLRKATGNFDERNRLGQGGYGTVYHARLPDSSADANAIPPADEESSGGHSHRTPTEVAVKMFSNGSKQDDFYHELAIINRLRHRNLVRLEGWCYKRGKLLLVYEYMPNGSLDKHLFHSPDVVLPWDRRYRILADVASALHYLHAEYEQTVIHRDIKASNIMLDSNFSARLGDFGLARAVDEARGSYTEVDLSGMPGTMGYVAPECYHTQRAAPESDVFAFGAVVLEVVSGRRPLDNQSAESSRMLSDWVWKMHREGRLQDAVDTRLRGQFDEGEAERLLLLGLACSHPVASERPMAKEILQIMYKTRGPPTVPVNKPRFVWPPMPDVDVSTLTTGTSSFVSSVSTTGAVGSGGGGPNATSGASGSVVAAAHYVADSPPEYNSDHYLTTATDLSVSHGR